MTALLAAALCTITDRSDETFYVFNEVIAAIPDILQSYPGLDERVLAAISA